MNQFYLNNAVGAPVSAAAGGEALSDAMKAFGQVISREELNVSTRLVLDKDPDLIRFGEFYLRQLLEAITDREEKRYALAILKGAYPMEDQVQMEDSDLLLLDASYKYNGADASNIAVAYSHGCLLLSLAFSDILKQDRLKIDATAKPPEGCPESFEIDNLYGKEANTKYIQTVLEQREGVSVDLFKEISGYGEVYSAVEHTFNRQTSAIQQSIAGAFHEAISQGLLVPHAGNGNNAITPNGELVRFESHTKKEKIYALAVYHPLALRVFMAQDKGELYILDIKSKKELGDGGIGQNQSLRTAEKRFKSMKSPL